MHGMDVTRSTAGARRVPWRGRRAPTFVYLRYIRLDAWTHVDNVLNVSNLGCALVISSLCRYLGVITHFSGGGGSGARASRSLTQSDVRGAHIATIDLGSSGGYRRENGMLAACAFGMWHCDMHHTLSRRPAHARERRLKPRGSRPCRRHTPPPPQGVP